MATRLRSRSSSLKNLPPESPSTLSADVSLNGLVVSGSSSASARSSPHWTVNDGKDRLAASKRPRQTVQLKHPKGAAASPSSSRPGSVGITDSSSNEPLSERRSLPRRVGDSPQPRLGTLSSRVPQALQSKKEDIGPAASASPGSRPLSSTAPPSIGSRPPLVPPRPAQSCGDGSLGREVASPQKRRTARASMEDEVASLRSPSVSGTSPSSSSTARVDRPRAKAAGPGLHDTDGVIFRPAVETPPTPLPRGRHRQWMRPGSSSGNSRASTPCLSLSSSLQRPLTGTATAIPDSVVSISFDEADGPPAVPRIAWSEGGIEDGVQGVEVLDLAMQIKRDLLAFRVEQGEENAATEGGDAHRPPEGDRRWRLSTPDARKSFEDMEKSLAKANRRMESLRTELGGYIDDLQSKVFTPPEAEAGGTTAERLVALPADFDDVVDLNAQITSAQRQGRGQQTSDGKADGADSGFKLPGFLEKYFLEDKAVEQLPHLQLQDQEEKDKGSEETELQKGLRQIARLDGLLAKREAAGSARLKAAKVDFEATKERLNNQLEEARKNRLVVLQKMKEKGLLRNGPRSSTDRSALSTPSTTASSASSARSSVSAVVEIQPRSMQEAPSAIVDWNAWTCSVAGEEPAAAPASLQPPTPAHSEPPDEPDAGTFLLTATTGHLGSLAGGRRQQVPVQRSSGRPPVEATLALATIQETERDGADATTLVSTAEKDVDDEEGEALLALGAEDAFTDVESLEALRRIDERLQKLVPESEWEAKSICSLPRGSTADSSQPRSVWSSHGPADPQAPALPGEPELRERAEMREASAALQAIEDRICQLQVEHSQPPENRPPDPQKLQKLLLKAAQEAAPLDADDKVRALTMQSFNGSSDESGQRALVPFVVPHARLPESAPLIEAKQVLGRLAGYAQEWDDANREADSAWQELEHEVRVFEESTAADSRAGQEGKEGTAEEEGATLAAELLDPLSSKLGELEKEISVLAEHRGPSAELVERLREEVSSGMPVLKSADAQDFSDDDEDLLSDDGDPTHLTFAAPSSAAAGPSPDLLHALDIQLPAGEGLWDDAELERVVRAMDAHYGDEPPALDLQEPAFVEEEDDEAEEEKEEEEEADGPRRRRT